MPPDIDPVPKELSQDERRILRKALRGATAPGSLTAYERARLRLDAWKALDGWGVAEQVPDDTPEWLKSRPSVRPWDWEIRKARADDLYEWIISL